MALFSLPLPFRGYEAFHGYHRYGYHRHRGYLASARPSNVLVRAVGTTVMHAELRTTTESRGYNFSISEHKCETSETSQMNGRREDPLYLVATSAFIYQHDDCHPRIGLGVGVHMHPCALIILP